jgi:chromosomal replication initiator protein
MSYSNGDILGYWPAIEELALTRSPDTALQRLLRQSRATAYDAERSTLRLAVEVDHLDKQEAETLRTSVGKACFQILGFSPRLEVVTTGRSGGHDGELRVSAQRAGVSTTSGAARDYLTPQQLQAGLDFTNFVVGPSNQLSFAAAKAVAENPGKAYNPLFIHGGVGLGKTHLITAVARKLLPDMPRVRLLSCEAFVNRFVEALKNGNVEAFRREQRESDVLLIDDIHFLAGKEQTQEEFFHTFNHLYQQGRQIVLTSDSLPRDIPDLEDRLISRFHWGLAVKIDPPCTETRMAIVRKKAEARGLSLPDDVVDLLADSIVTNVRELEGAVVQIGAMAGFGGRPISLQLAQEALRHLVRSKPLPTRITAEDIIELVCNHYSVRLHDLLSQRRTKNLAFPRHVAMFLTKELTQLTLAEIGHFFGGRDHSTVLHAINKIKGLRLKDPELRSELERFELHLRKPAS